MRISDWSSDVCSSDLGVVCSASLVRRAVTTISSRPRALTGRAPASARVGVAAPGETPVAGGSSEVPEAGAPLCATAGLANARASAEAPADMKNSVRNRDIKLPPLWHGQTAVAAQLYDCHAATCPIDAEVSITCMFEATKRYNESALTKTSREKERAAWR